MPDLRTLEGNSVELSGDDGAEFRVDAVGIDAVDATVSDGVASFEGLAAGWYYIACRSASDKPWRRYGKLLVESLVDDVREKLVKEISDLDSRLAAAEAIQHSITDPGGISVQRVQVGELRLQRSRAETRLAVYDKRMRGAFPGRHR